MADFANQTITTVGRSMLAESVASKKPITFTRIEIGDGASPQAPESLTAPVHKLFDVTVSRVRPVPSYPGVWLVTGSFIPREEKGDFYFREAAVFAKFDDPPESPEVLVAYLNSGDTADFIKAVSPKSQMQVDLVFAIVLGNAEVLSVTNPEAIPTIEDIESLAEEMRDAMQKSQDKLDKDVAGFKSDIQNFKDQTLGDLARAQADLEAAKNSFVLKAGDTMTGPLNIPSHSLSAKEVFVTAAVSAASANISGQINAASAALTGDLTLRNGTASDDLTAKNFRGSLIGGTVQAGNGNFSGLITGNLRGNVTGDLTGNSNGAHSGKWNNLSSYATGSALPGTPNLNTATIVQLSNAIVAPGICYHAFSNSSNSNLPEKTGILELRRISSALTTCLFTSPSGTSYTGCVNGSSFSGWRNTNNSSSVPPGSIIAFASATPPAGWILCDGRTLSTTSYAALYAAIGHTWGGSGTNFKIPDARGQFLRGHDNGRNLDPSRGFATSQSSGAPNITGHSNAGVYKGEGMNRPFVTPPEGAFYERKGGGCETNGGGSWEMPTNDFDASRCSKIYQNGLTEVRPTNIAICYVIKY